MTNAEGTRIATAEHKLTTIAELWRVYLAQRHGIQLALLPEDAGEMGALLHQGLWMCTGETNELVASNKFTELVVQMQDDLFGSNIASVEIVEQ